jgi:hypothetical protein
MMFPERSAPVVAVQVFPPDRPDRLRGPEDRRAEGVALPERRDEQLVDEVVRVVVRLADLLEDDAALHLDVRRTSNAGERTTSPSRSSASAKRVSSVVDVEAGVLLGREGVDVPPERSMARAIWTWNGGGSA